MKIQYLLSLYLLVFIFSCGTSNAQQEKDSTTASIPYKPLTFKERHDSLEAELGNLYDTTFASGYYLKYTLSDSNVVLINWGNKDFNRYVLDEGFPGWAPSSFKQEWKDFIGIEHSAGPGQWTHTLLPKNPNDSTFYYFGDIACDTIRNLILYGGRSRSELILENIFTKKKQKIVLNDIMEQGFWTEAIDTIQFKPEGLYIRWETMPDEYEGFPPLEKTFKINVLSRL